LALREHCIQRCRMLLLPLLDLAEKEIEERKSREEKKSEETSHQTLQHTDKDNKGSLKPATAAGLEVKPAPQVDRLMLATSLFQCEWCREHSLRFPDIFAHRCARKTDVAAYGGEETVKNWVNKALSTVGRGRPLYEGAWHFSLVINKLSEAQMANLVAVLELLKSNPKMTTFDEIERLNPVFECLRCHSSSKGRCLMDWTAIVSYLSIQPRCTIYRIIDHHRGLIIPKNVTDPSKL